MNENLINKLKQLASDWRPLPDNNKQKEKIAIEYYHVLSKLENSGWNSFLGKDHELPDKYLPNNYIKRRKSELRILEETLFKLACQYRQENIANKNTRITIQKYHDVLSKMFFIGNWCYEPDIFAQLADSDMPQFYHDYWNNSLRNE